MPERMALERGRVERVAEESAGIFLLNVRSPRIARLAQPGQFVNIRVADATAPLLRRPFSVSGKERDSVSVLFNIVGPGTRLLAEKRPGDELDLLGPLGNGFTPFISGDFDRAILVGGGLGVAPLPFLAAALESRASITTYLGARTRQQLVRAGLPDLHIATDDGSEGFHGTVVDLLRRELRNTSPERRRIFGCGPTPMLRALAVAAHESGIPACVSVECSMACGIGLCQGCPIETTSGSRKYLLVCKDGPVFETSTVIF